MGDGQQVERSSSVDPIVWPRVGQGQREGEQQYKFIIYMS